MSEQNLPRHQQQNQHLEKPFQKLQKQIKGIPSSQVVGVSKNMELKAKKNSKHIDDHKLLNKSSSRNIQPITLPHIPHQMNFGDKIFDKQSASTLQKTIVAYSMPKANRFSEQPKYNGEPVYCVDSCFKPNASKGVGFGFGGKRQYPAWMERNMKQNPPPGAYIETFRQLKNKGHTFGISHKYYEKVMIPKQKNSMHHTAKNLTIDSFIK